MYLGVENRLGLVKSLDWVHNLSVTGSAISQQHASKPTVQARLCMQSQPQAHPGGLPTMGGSLQLTAVPRLRIQPYTLPWQHGPGLTLIDRILGLQRYREEFTDGSDERLAELYDQLDTDHTGKVDFLSWSDKVHSPR